MTDMNEEKKEEPVQEEVKEEQPVSEEKNNEEKVETPESKTQETENQLISIQASRYLQIENLEKQLADNHLITDEEMGRVSFYKSQVLVELVAVADYVSQLPDNHPQKKAGDVLMKHLYKCYDKTERMQSQSLKKERETRYKKDVEHEFSNLDARCQRAYGGIISDDSLVPPMNVINLKGLALPTGAFAMISQLVNNPQKAIESQLPQLMEELGNRLSQSDRSKSTQIIGTLLTGLSHLKGEKSMTDALEGKNLAANILSIVAGNSL